MRPFPLPVQVESIRGGPVSEPAVRSGVAEAGQAHAQRPVWKGWAVAATWASVLL